MGIIGLCGFYQKNGMALMEIIRNVIRLMRKKAFTYETRMAMNEMDDFDDGKNNQKEKRDIKAKRKK